MAEPLINVSTVTSFQYCYTPQANSYTSSITTTNSAQSGSGLRSLGSCSKKYFQHATLLPLPAVAYEHFKVEVNENENEETCGSHKCRLV